MVGFWHQPALTRAVRLFVASTIYLIAFLLLDQLSIAFEIWPSVSLWYPSAGLSLALIIAFGWACSPALMIANIISLTTLHHLPLDASSLFICFAHTVCYTGAGLLLRRIIASKRYEGVQLVGRFLTISLLAPVLVALMACLALVLDHELAWDQYPNVAFGWWIGDTIGLVVITPLLLIYGFPWLKIWPARPTLTPTRPLETVAQLLCATSTLWIVFLSPIAWQHLLYLCFLPLIWVAMRSGLPGAIWGIACINIGALFGATIGHYPSMAIVDLQLLMLAIALTGQILGASIDERHQTALALQASEARARAIVQDQIDLVCRYRPDTTLTFVNEAYCTFFDRPAEQLLGRSILDLARPEYHPTIRNQVAELIRSRTPLIDESQIFRGDGELRWMQWLSRTVVDADGIAAEVQVVARDITERKRAEEAYRSLVDTSIQGLAITQNQQIVFANPALCAMLGYSVDELLGSDPTKHLSNPEQLAQLYSHIQNSLHTTGLQFFEIQITRKDGQRCWLDVTLIRTTYVNAPAMMVMALDITARKQAEAARLQAEERYRVISQLTSDYAYMHAQDPDGEMQRVWLAGAFVRITGYSIEELDLQGGWEAIIYPPDLPSVIAKRAQLPHGIPYEIEFRVIHKDGSLRWLHNAVQPELAPVTGQLIRIYGAVQDITERKQAEEERLQIERRLQETQKLESIGLLAGGIAHDFNNLLVSMMGNAALAMAELPFDAPARESIHQVEIATHHAADLTRQLLAYAGKSRVVMQIVEINPLIQEMLTLLRLGVPRQIDIIPQLGLEIPAIEGDISQIRQVLMNIVINAAEAIEQTPGTITITTSTTWADRALLASAYLGTDLPIGDYVLISIRDTGRGMDAITQSRIFEPFFTTKFTGRGLGLAAVLGIVRSHRGALMITSTPGIGTTFTILLPMLPQEHDQALLIPDRDSQEHRSYQIEHRSLG